VYYINTITQRRCHEVPPELPKGWREALHKESGRVYYYHKATRMSTFELPTEEDIRGEDDEDGDDDEPPPAPEGIFSRTMTLLRGKKDKDDISRTSTMTRRSFRPGNARRSAAVGRYSVSERFLHNLAQAPRLRRKRRLLRALALRRRSSSHARP